MLCATLLALVLRECAPKKCYVRYVASTRRAIKMLRVTIYNCNSRTHDLGMRSRVVVFRSYLERMYYLRQVMYVCYSNLCNMQISNQIIMTQYLVFCLT